MSSLNPQFICPQVAPLTNTREQPLYFKSEILGNAHRVLKKSEKIHKNHKHIDLSLPQMIC